jgi:hypothetical protein
MPYAPATTFWAPGLAEILVRPLDHGDHFCGNESVQYAPFSRNVDVQPGFTLTHTFKAKELGETWSDPNCRGSFVGRVATPLVCTR